MEEMMTRNVMSFDVVADQYTRVRPGYPKELYDVVAQYKRLTRDSHVLEIGAGQGVATQEIYEQWQSHITALEPGMHFCHILRTVFRNNPKITILQETFEQRPVIGKFDAIFSATAFHWLDPQTKYRRASDNLQEDGLLVVYWNYYSTSKNAIFEPIQHIYRKYGLSHEKSQSGDAIRDEKIAARKHEFQSSAYFELMKEHIYTRIFEYTAENYVKLLLTFPDHTSVLSKKGERDGFLNEIHAIISQNNRVVAK